MKLIEQHGSADLVQTFLKTITRFNSTWQGPLAKYA